VSHQAEATAEHGLLDLVDLPAPVLLGAVLAIAAGANRGYALEAIEVASIAYVVLIAARFIWMRASRIPASLPTTAACSVDRGAHGALGSLSG
jgi:hypothetical protein